MEEYHKDVQELMEADVNVDELKNNSTFLIDERTKKRWKYKISYINPVGVEVIILESL